MDCEHCVKVPRHKNKLILTLAATALFLIITNYYSPMKQAFHTYMEYVGMIWWAILLGFLIGGIIDYFVPDKYITKILSSSKKRTVFYSVILGFLMSACSHGILAIAMELYKKGASVSSTIAFLLASPWANLPVTILLFGFFGINAIYLILSAIIIAIITGLIFQILERNNIVEKSLYESDESFSVKADIKEKIKNVKINKKNASEAIRGVYQGSVSLSKMVLWWILIGIMLASLASLIPSEHFQTYFGPTLLGLAITLIAATIIEVCSEGSAPLAFEIFRQTGAFGNSFVFLMAGVATDYTEIGLIWSNIGKRSAFLLPVITVPQILILGWLFNLFL